MTTTQAEIIKLSNELELTLHETKQHTNERVEFRFGYFVITIVISLTKLLIYYNRKISDTEKYWFQLSRSLDEDFGGGSSIHQQYCQLVELLESSNYLMD